MHIDATCSAKFGMNRMSDAHDRRISMRQRHKYIALLAGGDDSIGDAYALLNYYIYIRRYKRRHVALSTCARFNTQIVNK